MNEPVINRHFWAEITPLQYHVREQCAVHSVEAGEGPRGLPVAAKLVIGNVTVYLDDVNALRVAAALNESVINYGGLSGQR